MSQRLKGQDTIVTILKDGDLQARISAIQSCEVSFDLDLLEEDYLGEVASRFDSIFKGCTVRISIHHENRQGIDMIDAIVKKAQRRAGGATQIDVATTLVFPNGDLVTIGLQDVQFGPAPVNSGGRAEYVETSYEGKASDYELL